MRVPTFIKKRCQLRVAYRRRSAFRGTTPLRAVRLVVDAALGRAHRARTNFTVECVSGSSDCSLSPFTTSSACAVCSHTCSGANNYARRRQRIMSQPNDGSQPKGVLKWGRGLADEVEFPPL
jgi:hypothetical protein